MQTIPGAIKEMAHVMVKNVKKDTGKLIAKHVRKFIFMHIFNVAPKSISCQMSLYQGKFIKIE